MVYIPNLTIPAPNQIGWKREQISMIPIFVSRNAIPQECLELVPCQCQKGCQTMCCKCRNTRLQGTGACIVNVVIYRRIVHASTKTECIIDDECIHRCGVYNILCWSPLLDMKLKKCGMLFKWIWDTTYRTRVFLMFSQVICNSFAGRNSSAMLVMFKDCFR